MTGDQHYDEAERLLSEVTLNGEMVGPVGDGPEVEAYIAKAQVHATLALAAATKVGMDAVGERFA